jgi:3-oxoacyl-[acyl-carrier-protein] synthase III
VKIRAIAHAVPSRCVTNGDLLRQVAARNRATLPPSQLDELCAFLDAQLERAGAVERYHRDTGESALDFGIRAGRQALERAGLSPASIDLLIYVGVGRGFVEPATANVFQHALHLHNATCFDILDACASWLRALDVVRCMLRAGSYRRAMILNCEFNFQEYEPSAIASRAEMEDLWAGYTVGEAATATIVSAAEQEVEYHVSFRNLGQHVPLCQIPLPHAAQFQNGDRRTDRPGMRFYAQPNPLAASAIREISRQYWDDPCFHNQRHDIVFGHSASVPVSRAIRERLGIDERLHYELFPRYGNTVSAAIPLAMSLALQEGRLRRGNRVLLVMGGAGITTALGTFVF